MLDSAIGVIPIRERLSPVRARSEGEISDDEINLRHLWECPTAAHPFPNFDFVPRCIYFYYIVPEAGRLRVDHYSTMAALSLILDRGPDSARPGGTDPPPLDCQRAIICSAGPSRQRQQLPARRVDLRESYGAGGRPRGLGIQKVRRRRGRPRVQRRQRQHSQPQFLRRSGPRCRGSSGRRRRRFRLGAGLH
jgi:hypothetical protein